MNGGKADNLARLRRLGLPVPGWIVIGPEEEALAPALERRLAAGGMAGACRFAVRSSASAEDGGACSFAGQFETLLAVPRERLADAVRDVRASVTAPAVLAYCRERGIDAAALRMNVIVQEMVEADRSGVAFGVDFKTGSRQAVTVSAVLGLGEGLVSERAEADTFVELAGRISSTIVRKEHAVRYAANGGTTCVALSGEACTRPVLTAAQVRDIADVVRRLSAALGRPQDVEWALTAEGELKLLQTRPITTLGTLPDPDEERLLWDNSNIVESYPGVTLPLTFSFARAVYTAVYRQFCLALGVEPAVIDANAKYFEMLGHWRGRFYYNLLNWYRMLMLLPGYRINAAFMEQMMGVKEPLREKPVIVPSRRPEWLRVVSSVGRIVWSGVTLKGRVEKFMRRFDAVVAPLEAADFTLLSLAELAETYRALEAEFIVGWRTPLVNDFFAMISYGALRKALARWGVDAAGANQNDLLVGVGDIVSAEPMRRLGELAEAVRADAALRTVLETQPASAFLSALPAHPAFERLWRAYIRKFGSRCMGELKLETVTYDLDPTPLVGMLRGYLAVPPPQAKAPPPLDLSALDNHPVRRLLFRRLRDAARRHVANRENLRFRRTRLFAVVRRILLAFGARLAREGYLGEARDVFYLTMGEVMGCANGCAAPGAFADLVAVRKAAFAAYAREAPPPERFETRGAVILPAASAAKPAVGADGLCGIGCCRGVVRGTARVIRDLGCAGEVAGRILVAERTDPGWGPLFPLAKGVLVERGSVLSHAAILTRELGIPCVVGVTGLLAAVADGDEVELDGTTGVVRVLAKGGGSHVEDD